MTSQVQIVWYKRDLRVADHEPLARAAGRGPVLPLYICEPSWLHADDADPMHWTFIRASLEELRLDLANLGQPLVVRTGEAVAVLQTLVEVLDVGGIWAHEETGNLLSYDRDRAVRRWAREGSVPFTEIPTNGVIRRLPTRDVWADRWERRMRQPLIEPPARLLPVAGVDPGPIPTHTALGLAPDVRTGAQPAGEHRAHVLLDSFLTERGEDYTAAMSSPVSAEDTCSRLSPHLTWGNISMRQVVHAMRARQAELRAQPPERRGGWLRAMSSFEARLHWRDHFIQKLEDEPRIEVGNVVTAYDGLREDEFDRAKYEAWATGRTGYPLVDACMRKLLHTGWVNFRMRAMLVSFASYDLWLHWREPGLHLARVFLDYEPGIHWPQHQMQAGTTGINTLRIYSPTKQALDQDPTGSFIREWVPELAAVPTSFIHQPWRMPTDMQRAVGCLVGRDYPAPIVDHDSAAAAAKRRIALVRKLPETRRQADAVQEKHGSRRRPPQPARRRRDPAAAPNTAGQLPLMPTPKR